MGVLTNEVLVRLQRSFRSKLATLDKRDEGGRGSLHRILAKIRTEFGRRGMLYEDGTIDYYCKPLGFKRWWSDNDDDGQREAVDHNVCDFKSLRLDHNGNEQREVEMDHESCGELCSNNDDDDDDDNNTQNGMDESEVDNEPNCYDSDSSDNSVVENEGSDAYADGFDGDDMEESSAGFESSLHKNQLSNCDVEETEAEGQSCLWDVTTILRKGETKTLADNAAMDRWIAANPITTVAPRMSEDDNMGRTVTAETVTATHSTATSPPQTAPNSPTTGPHHIEQTTKTLPVSSPSSPGTPTYAARLPRLTAYCGIPSPSKLEPGQAPIQAPMKYNGSRPLTWKCIICDAGFYDKRRVFTHFPDCVKRNGNPNAYHWYDHDSIDETNLPNKLLQ